MSVLAALFAHCLVETKYEKEPGNFSRGIHFSPALAVSAEAASLTVNSAADAGGTCPGTTCTLRQAIATAASGDTINFAAGVTTITLTSGELLINKNLTINGPGANLLSVQRNTASGTPVFRIFNISNISNGTTSGLTVTISGLTIANGLAHSESGDFASSIGGGIVNNHGTLAVESCTLSGNTAVFGGGIYNQGDGGYAGEPAQAPATLTITNSTFSRNSANVYDGGAIYNDGEVGNNGKAGLATLNILNSTFSQNSASIAGGGIYNDGISGNALLNITNSTFSQNSGPNGGGAIYNDGSSRGSATFKIGNTILNKGGASGQNIFNDSGAVTSLGYNMSDDNGQRFPHRHWRPDQHRPAARPRWLEGQRRADKNPRAPKRQPGYRQRRPQRAAA